MKKNLKLFIIAALILLLGLTVKTQSSGLSFKTDLITNLVKLTDIFYLPYAFKNHSLPVYQLNLNPDNYIALSQTLPNPIERSILTDQYAKSVPAKFTYQGQEYDVDVHYWGTDPDHWTRPKKSWQIALNDQKPFNSQTIINLIIPESSDIYLKALSHYQAKKMGLIVPETQFVILKVNGQTQGVYFQVEDLTSSFLETKQLPVGNLYGQDEEVLPSEETAALFKSVKYWRKYVSDEIFEKDNYAELAQLLDLINNAPDEEFFQKLPALIDIDNLLTWQVHTLISGNLYRNKGYSLKLYWQPALGKFIIIPWNVSGNNDWSVSYQPLVSRVLKNPDWLAQRNQILADYVNQSANLEDDLAYFDQLVAQTRTAIFQDYRKFFSNLEFIRQTKKTRQALINQLQLIKTNLDSNNFKDKVSDFNLPFSPPLDVTDSSKTIIDSEFQDFDKLFQPPQKLVYSGLNYINQTIIIPPGYQVKLLTGSKLIFAPDVSFISFSPVQAQGTTLTAQDPAKPWGVFAVLSPTASNSSFDQIIVEHGSQAVVNGAYFTGALAAHQAQNISVTNSIFRYNHGDDGLNIKYDSQPLVANNQFIANEWDGLDLDFSQGEVIGNTLLNNGNDGLDFGSASSLVKNNLVDGSGDKCISLGETSNAKLEANILKNCNMAIAVKDSSQPEIIDNQIIHNHIGLASYQKKPIFPRKPFIFKDNLLLNNEIDFEETDSSLRRESL